MTVNACPVTVLTGYLGSGKTTLMNRILGDGHRRRFAVIENEFGEVGVDAELVSQTHIETIVQLTNGCICCTVRGDLANALHDLGRRRAAGEIAFDHILIETTGLADPGPLVRTFLAETALSRHFYLDGVVAVVDAVNGLGTVRSYPAAQAQVAYADRLFVSKRDCVPDGTVSALTAQLRTINPAAEVVGVDLIHDDLAALLGGLLEIHGYQFDSVRLPVSLEIDRHPTGHLDGVTAICFEREGSLDGARLDATLAALQGRYPETIWRLKGVLAVDNARRKIVLQGVNGLTQSHPGTIWRPYERRCSRLVIIGHGLDRDWILGLLTSCVSVDSSRIVAAR